MIPNQKDFIDGIIYKEEDNWNLADELEKWQKSRDIHGSAYGHLLIILRKHNQKVKEDINEELSEVDEVVNGVNKIIDKRAGKL